MAEVEKTPAADVFTTWFEARKSLRQARVRARLTFSRSRLQARQRFITQRTNIVEQWLKQLEGPSNGQNGGDARPGSS
jgi:hypothetical protein